MKDNLAKRIEAMEQECPAAPIIKPEELQNQEIMQAATALMKSDKQGMLELPEYTLPERLQADDPRNIFRRAYDAMAMELLPETKAARIAQRIRDQKEIAEARMQYQWLEKATGIIRSALESQQAAYTNISGYMQSTGALVDQARAATRQGEQNIESLVVRIDKLETDLKDKPWEKFLKGEQAQQTAARVKNEIRDAKQQVTKTNRENEYLGELAGHYAHVTEACRDSLQSIEETMEASRRQVFGLAQTLHTYKGLTENQIKAIEATKFLRDVRAVTGALQQSMTTIDNMLAAESEAYQLAAPSATAKAPDPKNIAIRQEMKMLREYEK